MGLHATCAAVHVADHAESYPSAHIHARSNNERKTEQRNEPRYNADKNHRPSNFDVDFTRTL